MGDAKWTFGKDVPHYEDVDCDTSCDSVTVELNQFSDAPVCIEADRAGSAYVDHGDHVTLWFTPDQARAFAAKLIEYADRCVPVVAPQD